MRLFKRPSTSPQLVSATPIPQDGVPSAARTAEDKTEVNNDVPTRVDDAKHSPKPGNDAGSLSENTMPAPSSFSARKGISTWGRKVGRRWDQLKRSESSELLSVSGRRRRWSPNRKSLCDATEDKDKDKLRTEASSSVTKPKRISRVESLRNLFRGSDRAGENNANGDVSSRSVTIEEEDDVDLGHYTMDKALSEGALRNLAPFRLSSETSTESLEEKKNQISRNIKSFQEQQRVFDYILKNQEILNTQEGMILARDTLHRTENVVQNNANGTEEERIPGNVDLDKSDSSTRTQDSGKSNVKRNLFNLKTANGDNERTEQRRSFIGSGLDELMCTLRLGCDESGYDSDSTRAGADSPDSEKAISAMLKRRSFSITSDDYQGIDLSLPVSTPKKKDVQATIAECDRVELPCPEAAIESANEDVADSTFDESIRTETTLMSDDDDTDSCNEETFEEFSNFRYASCAQQANIMNNNNNVPKSKVTAGPTCANRTPKKIESNSEARLIAKRDVLRTPIKREIQRDEDTMPLVQRVKLQNLQKDRKTQVALKGRKASNASVLNLLDNAASPSKDSPPASKIRSPAPFNYVQYYSPKRSRSNMEAESNDTATPMNPIKRPVFATPLAPHQPPPPPSSSSKTLVRRELKTMKLSVDRTGCLGISVEKREAVRPFYVVSRLEASGEAAKSKQIRVGDEVVRVSGRRLRGMSAVEARNALKNCQGIVELQIAREPTFNFAGELGDTWGEPISRTRSDSEVWTLNEQTDNREGKIADTSCPMEKDTPSCRVVGALTKDGKSVSMSTVNITGKENEAKDKITGMRKFQVMRKRNSMPAARPKRATSLSMDLLTVTLEKGATKKLGFSIVGGSDSNKGSMGIFVKEVMAGGQAAEEGTLRAGDEILAINGQSLDGLTHAKALQYFKIAKPGKMMLHIGRRDPTHKRLLNRRS